MLPFFLKIYSFPERHLKILDLIVGKLLLSLLHITEGSYRAHELIKRSLLRIF